MLKIDKKDRNILSILNNNCRESNAKIGKAVGLSRDSVAYRIKNLENKKIIEGYTIEIDYEKLGYVAYSCAIKLQNVLQGTEEKIMSFLINNKKVAFVEKTFSKYDIVFIIISNSIEQIEKEINKIRKITGKNLKNIDMGISLDTYEFPNFIFNNNKKYTKEINKIKNYILDKHDKQILYELVNDSKKSVVELSREVKLSVFAIANRIKKLYQSGIIYKFKAIINPIKLGYNKYTLLLNVFDSKIEKNLFEFCKKHKQIWEIDKSLSNYNYAIEIYAKHNEEFKEVIEEIMNEFSKSVIDYETLIVIKKIKHRYFLLSNE